MPFFYFISKQFVSSTIFLICEKLVNVHFPMKERQKANYAGWKPNDLHSPGRRFACPGLWTSVPSGRAGLTFDTPSNCYFPRLACKFTCRTWTCSLTWNFYNTMTISTRRNIIVVLWTTCCIRTSRKILCNHLSFLILLHNSQIYRLCLYPIERLDFLYYLLPFKRFGIFFMLLFVDILPFLKCRDISLWLFFLGIVIN